MIGRKKLNKGGFDDNDAKEKNGQNYHRTPGRRDKIS